MNICSLRQFLLWLLITNVFICYSAPSVAADIPEVSLVPPDLREDYSRIVRDPTNLETLYAAASKSVALGEISGLGAETYYRFALRLLERAKIIDPTAKQFDVMIGRIHFILGNHIEARAHLEPLLQDPEVPNHIRERAKAYVRLSRKASRTSVFSVNARTGIRYQTNVTSGFETDNEFSPLDAAILQGLGYFQKESDFDWSSSLALRHRYDPGGQMRTAFETRLTLDMSKKFTRSDLDTYSGELRFGPRMEIGLFRNSLVTIWPAAISGVVGVDDSLLAEKYGIGLEADIRVHQRLGYSFDVKAVNQSFRGGPDLFGFENDGTSYSLRMGVRHRMSQRVNVAGSFMVEFIDADAPDQDNKKAGLSLAAQYLHAPLLGIGGRDWVTSATVGYERDRFDKLPALVRRSDELYSIDISTAIPLTNNTSLVSEIGYRNRKLDTFAGSIPIENWDASIGLAHQF